MQRKRFEKEVKENTQNYSWKGVLLIFYHTSSVPHSDAPRQLGAKRSGHIYARRQCQV
jgi:hypothetical protein